MDRALLRFRIKVVIVVIRAMVPNAIPVKMLHGISLALVEVSTSLEESSTGLDIICFLAEISSFE